MICTRPTLSRDNFVSQSTALLQASLFTLSRHHLLRRTNYDLVQVATDLCGLHAQLSSAPGVSLWARMQHVAPDEVDQALYRDRSLVKVWVMRGTLHVIPTAELPLYHQAVQRGRIDGLVQWLDGLDHIQADERRQAHQRILDALADRPHTRKEIYGLVPELAGLPYASWGADVRELCYQGLVLHAEPVGAEIRFARLDQWLPGLYLNGLDPMRARKQLARKYFATYGPATVQDFAYWTGYGVAWARTTLESLIDDLAEVEIEGQKGCFYLRREDLPLLNEVSGEELPVRLLPKFDPILMGHKDKSRFLSREHQPRVFTAAGHIQATVWVGGRVAGVWRYDQVGRKLVVTVQPFAPFSASTWDAIEEEIQSFGRFMGTDRVELECRL